MFNLSISEEYHRSQMIAYRSDVLLSREETRSLIARAQAGDNAALDLLVMKNQLLVKRMVNKHLSSAGDFEYMDLMQCGNWGLVVAIQRFDLSRDVEFSTYATWWIRQKILRNADDHGHLVSLPISLREQIKKVKRNKYMAGQEAGYENVRPDEVPRKFVREALNALRPVLRLDTPVSSADGDEDLEYINTIRSAEPSPEEAYDAKNEALYAALGVLEEQHKDIILSRFGLCGHEVETLDQIGNRYGLSRERIRQLEKDAMKLLRKAISRP